MTKTAWLGVDVAKRKFDVAILRDGRKRAKVFANEPAGWRQLCEWLGTLGLDPVHACLEATGRYGDGLALALHEAGHQVNRWRAYESGGMAERYALPPQATKLP